MQIIALSNLYIKLALAGTIVINLHYLEKFMGLIQIMKSKLMAVEPWKNLEPLLQKIAIQKKLPAVGIKETLCNSILVPSIK